jgi:SNF2 family DNA or RNA helicase
VRKKELFAKVRQGKVRVLLGSTFKMGAGTNCQDRLIALHHLDVPWRPSDLEQREGRIIRQGNKNPEVEVYRYVTEQTFVLY